MMLAEQSPEPLPTNEESKEIKPINKETVHRICSGQVVLSLAIAMKELVENSLDAGATIIDIHLIEYGSELLEVSDNGAGVNSDNFEALTLKHHTSKLKNFEDLEHIGTLGFRGEALSSLCALAEVEIATRHSTAETATKLRYNHGGIIMAKEPFARQQGTTVTLKNLFYTLPVRKKEFTKNLKKEFAKMCNLLYAYCLLPNGVKYTCTNTTSKGISKTLITTEGLTKIRENIISLFGIKQLSSLSEVLALSPDQKTCEEYGINPVLNMELPFDWEFLISSATHNSGRSSTDRQFYYINNRPCEPSKIIKLVNEVYKSFNNKQYPFVYLNIKSKSLMVDVNITPDKRQVFVEQEKLLLATIKMSLTDCFKDCPSTFELQNLDISQSLTKKGVKRPLSQVDLKNSSILDAFGKKSKNSSLSEAFGKKSKVDNKQQSVLKTFMKNSIDEVLNTNNIKEEDIINSQAEADRKLEMLVNIACKLVKEDNCKKDDQETILDISVDNPREKANDREEVLVKFDFNAIKERLEAKCQIESKKQDTVKFRTNLTAENEKTAIEELSRHITKADFSQMEIIGQFNMGFIITRLLDDLFIVDQHATDEKYNFEQLQLNTVLETQKLVSPKLLELTPAAKTVLSEHESVFRKNGFGFQAEPDGKILLTSIPMSERTIFDKGDIDEMIFILQEDPSQEKTCRPSRVRAMFASRACRKSVMIGQPLSREDMVKLVNHMGEIEQPWNCPHGRPTMRHLVNLGLLMDEKIGG